MFRKTVWCFSSLNISSHSRAARRIFQIIAALGFRLKRQKKSLGKILPKQPVRAQNVPQDGYGVFQVTIFRVKAAPRAGYSK
jgi:hypothetical protein